MDTVQLEHPEGKNGIAMDRKKYETLQRCLLNCLKNKQPLPFSELLSAVERRLKNEKEMVKGKLEWNLFWVSLDLEAKKKINKDKSVSPIVYSIIG